jgi:EmrB/QacA subfamily drug resistance transporter
MSEAASEIAPEIAQEITSSPAAALTEPTRRELRMVFGGLISAMMLAALDQNIVNTALPRIASELGGLSHLSWVVTAFMLTAASTTPLYGKLSDMYGRKRLFVVAISIFVISSMLCGLSRSMMQLIIFRGVQGLGAGGLMVLAQSTIGDVVKPAERGRYQGVVAGSWAISSIAGPPLGGFITSALSWRWVFYVNVPVGAISLALIIIGLRRARKANSHVVDYPGAALIASATTCLLLLMNWAGTLYPWFSPQILALTGAFLVLLTGALIQERRSPEPIVNLHLVRNPAIAPALAASITIAVAMFGEFVFLPVYFQIVLDQTPASSGAMMVPQVVTATAASFIGGRFMTSLSRSRAILMVAATSNAVALALLGALAWYKLGLFPVALTIMLLGGGMGVTMPALTILVQNAVDQRQMGAATALLSFSRSLGAATGVALAGGIAGHWIAGFTANDNIHTLAPALVSAYREAVGTILGTGGAMMLVSVFFVSRLPRGNTMARS